MNTTGYLLVGIGGFIGAILRYMVAGIVPKKGDIPTGTLTVNIMGTTILSYLTYSHSLQHLYLLNIGILGSFTTFSTFTYESFTLLEQQANRSFLTNIMLNCVCCIAGVGLGPLMANLI
ncbi:fluoride efflux transporter FluC [Methanohalophilus mahii]|uniref:Fluoride-specific ion channel FluC n=1 Tax=Methanohalophilus mahii (strain ATCC 35705 / DSM 5219 / SLP) TaxID=547558 RepID=D5E7T4_METMS|nr:CrcB family protein [Methanohalophilus mahii]ADE37222.1 camphor resistance protein CrcB [Methanohalophilus mahii DSM 5219]